jgi:type IV pilus assembly protein PilW
MLNLDGTVGATAVLANDWKRYRYKVYETLVPLRNMMWGATS